MTKRNIQEVRRILSCGAKNSVIARTLNERGYYYRTYGWDKVKGGIYYGYNNDTNDFYPYCEAKLDKDFEVNDNFYYAQSISNEDIAALKRLYLQKV